MMFEKHKRSLDKQNKKLLEEFDAQKSKYNSIQEYYEKLQRNQRKNK